MRVRLCNASRDVDRFIHVHLVFKLHNYKTPKLAAYADDSADAQSMDSTQILTGIAILYATDNVFVIVDRVGREIVAEQSCLFCFKFVVRSNFFPYSNTPST